jgi:histidyl-tRNA synthetase
MGSVDLARFIADRGLRYDLTVPFARFVVQHRNDISFPFKRYQIQPVWRADRPQKGRYREFYQCDADIIGTKSLWNEVELTLLIHDVFERLNLEDFELKVNHREVLFEMAASCGLKGKEIPFCVALDKLDKIGKESVLEELYELGSDNKIEQLLAVIESNKSDIEKLKDLRKQTQPNDGYEQLIEFLDIINGISERKFKISLDFSLARGLTYYTGMIYEVKPTSVNMGSICGGGRYDDLTGVFGLPDVSGIGISFGLDRIYDVIDELGLFPEETRETPEIILLHLDDICFKHSLKIVDQLRKNNISSDVYPEPAKLKKQFNYANKRNIPYVLTIGQDEIESGNYSVKNMKSGEQQKLTLAEIIRKLKS